MNKLECALKGIPESIIKSVINEQMKKTVRAYIEDQKYEKLVDSIIEKTLIKYLTTNSKKMVATFLNGSGSRVVEEAIKDAFDNDGLPDASYNVICKSVDSFIRSKFTKKNNSRKKKVTY